MELTKEDYQYLYELTEKDIEIKRKIMYSTSSFTRIEERMKRKIENSEMIKVKIKLILDKLK